MTIRERLESHARACRGEVGVRLSKADLRSADLRSADLPQIAFVGNVGSRHGVLMLHIPDMTYRAGCWTGTRAQLLARLDQVYPTGQHRAGAARAALKWKAERDALKADNERLKAEVERLTQTFACREVER